MRARLATAPPDLAAGHARSSPATCGRGAGPDPWTDDRAPVEWVTDRMIAAYALRGAAIPETLLPTAPR